MAGQQNSDHIQTTHIGSLPRPHNLLDLLKAKYAGQSYDERELNSVLANAVSDCVRKQVDCGIEIVTDGEYSKPGFFTYIRERFDGFEARPNQKLILFQQEVSAFPGILRSVFQGSDDGRRHPSDRARRLHRTGEIQGRSQAADRYREREGRRQGRRRPGQSCVSAGDRAVGCRHQRVLQNRRGILPRARCRTEQGIPGDCRRRTLWSR